MRLDTELVNRKLYPTRSKAAAAIGFGLVSVNGKAATRASMAVGAADKIDAAPLPYISGRGGLKLSRALQEFKIDPRGMTCLDVGSSTGGFTEVLLNSGARRIISVDVGTNQMIPELRCDPRVELFEETDIRTLRPTRDVDLIVADVSFISLAAVAPSLAAWNAPQIIALIKPQFEVPRGVAAKCNGVIKSARDRDYSIEQVTSAFAKAGFERAGLTESPITGGSGNTEYLALFQRVQKI
jgi:23S rRNA (cytidine1920-2'-O)/16S rRNA (cytidine1409-2'-O)-methyltransferase